MGLPCVYFGGTGGGRIHDLIGAEGISMRRLHQAQSNNGCLIYPQTLGLPLLEGSP